MKLHAWGHTGSLGGREQCFQTLVLGTPKALHITAYDAPQLFCFFFKLVSEMKFTLDGRRLVKNSLLLPWLQGVFRPDFKSLLSSGGSQRKCEQSPEWPLEKDQRQVLPRVTALLFSRQLFHFLPVLSPVDFDSCQSFLVFLISCFSFSFAGEGLSSYRCQGLCDPCWHWDILCCLLPDFESASGCDNVHFLFCSFHFEITADSPNPGKSSVLYPISQVVTSFNVIVQYSN